MHDTALRDGALRGRRHHHGDNNGCLYLRIEVFGGINAALPYSPLPLWEREGKGEGEPGDNGRAGDRAAGGIRPLLYPIRFVKNGFYKNCILEANPRKKESF